MASKKQNLRIAFCHPDLGLGGAERLVVDAACELCDHGHTVDVYTAYYDKNRCFKETLTGQFSVTEAGSCFPRTVFNRMHALCAYVRCMLVAMWIAYVALRQTKQYDVIFVDQVSAAIPVLLLLTRSKVLFYCHFPDLLLAQKRSGIHGLYRWPLDAIEELTTGQAHQILVNSKFTQGIFRETFRRLDRQGKVPEVFYPAVPIPMDDELAEAQRTWRTVLKPELAAFMEGKHVFLSINRFERKKNLALAVTGFKAMLEEHCAQPGVADSILVIAGGYDRRLAENREHFEELMDLVAKCQLQGKVMFVQSFTDAERGALLAASCAVVYTPTNEHFGIVPLEAMAAGRPVLACNSGGPRESVLHGTTGLLAEPQPDAFARAMAQLADTSRAQTIGKLAREHVHQKFSRQAFGDRLNDIVRKLAANRI